MSVPNIARDNLGSKKAVVNIKEWENLYNNCTSGLPS